MSKKKIEEEQEENYIDNNDSATSGILDNENAFDQNAEMFKFMKEFFSIKNLKLKTEIPAREVKKLTRIYFYGLYIEKYDKNLSTQIKNTVKEYMILQISKNRESRNEFFRIFNQFNNEQKLSLTDKIRGLLKWIAI